MITADKKKVIYIHIYKTGGSSITNLLMPYISENYRSKNPKTEGACWQRTWHIDRRMHSKFCEAIPVADKLNVDLDEYFKFAFVRNPYSWILSVWNNFFQSPTGNLKMTWKNYLLNQIGKVISKKSGVIGSYAQYFYRMYPDGSFKSFILFIDRMVTEKPELAENFWGCYDQYSFIENDRNIQFDFIGKFENLEEDLKTIFSRVEGNATASISIPHVVHGSDRNKKERQNYLQYYDRESIEIVNKVFVRDFEIFGYQPVSSLSLHTCS